MDRTRVRRRLGAALLTVGLVAGVAGTAASASGPFREDARLIARHRYVVRAGDTLWTIAERQAAGGDPRPVVDAIAQANELRGAAIVPGQTLSVP